MIYFAVVVLSLSAAVLIAALYFRHRLRTTADAGNLEAALDAEAHKYMSKGWSYGLVIGAYRNGRSLIKGYGTLQRDASAPPTATTLFELASVGKLFTASTLQILCDRGVLSMEATLGELLGDIVALSPAARGVTLRQLVTHTSGFPPLPKSFLSKMTDRSNPYKDLRLEDLYEYLRHTDDKRPPGRFAYSNFGMGLLGHVIGIATRKTYEAAVTEALLDELNMASTAVTLDDELRGQLIQGYDMHGNPNPVWTDEVLTGAGSFKSNAADMMRFIRANLEVGDQPLGRSLRNTHERQPGGNTAIGWMQPTFIDRFVGNDSILWHNGRVGGYASYLSIDPEHRTGVVLLSNKSVDVTMMGAMLTRLVRTHSFAGHATQPAPDGAAITRATVPLPD